MRCDKKLLLFILSVLLNIQLLVGLDSSFLIKSGDRLYINSFFSDDVKVNGKIVLWDLTNDMLNYITVRETTTDILTSGKYLYLQENIEQIKFYENLFRKALKLGLEKKFIDNNFEILLSDYENDSSDDFIIISVEVNEMSEGQFNLIKNIPTKLMIIAKIHKNNSEDVPIVLLKKKYKEKSDINYPIEQLRIEAMVKNISNDIYKSLKFNFLNFRKK